MLLHREFVDTEEVSVSRFRGGRTGGEAKMAWDCEAVEGVSPGCQRRCLDLERAGDWCCRRRCRLGRSGRALVLVPGCMMETGPETPGKNLERTASL